MCILTKSTKGSGRTKVLIFFTRLYKVRIKVNVEMVYINFNLSRRSKMIREILMSFGFISFDDADYWDGD